MPSLYFNFTLAIARLIITQVRYDLSLLISQLKAQFQIYILAIGSLLLALLLLIPFTVFTLLVDPTSSSIWMIIISFSCVIVSPLLMRWSLHQSDWLKELRFYPVPRYWRWVALLIALVRWSAWCWLLIAAGIVWGFLNQGTTPYWQLILRATLIIAALMTIQLAVVFFPYWHLPKLSRQVRELRPLNIYVAAVHENGLGSLCVRVLLVFTCVIVSGIYILKGGSGGLPILLVGFIGVSLIIVPQVLAVERWFAERGEIMQSLPLESRRRKKTVLIGPVVILTFSAAALLIFAHLSGAELWDMLGVLLFMMIFAAVNIQLVRNMPTNGSVLALLLGAMWARVSSHVF